MSGQVAGNKCSYLNCGLSKRLDPSLSLYRFPVKDTTRCQKWIVHSGNGALLDLSPQSLRKKFICSKHFTELRIDSRALPFGAVPIHYSTVEEFTEDEENFDIPQISSVSTYSSEPNNLLVQPSCSSNIVHHQRNNSDSENEDPDLLAELQNLPLSVQRRKRKRPLEEELRQCKEQLKTARKKINNLKTQLTSTRKMVKKAQLWFQVEMRGGEHSEQTTEFKKALMKMQLRHRNKSPWLPSEKRTALALFYKGPKTYRYLRQKGITLPAVSTLKTWIANFSCKPGFNRKIFTHLAIKADTMLPWEKQCILMFDEMAIKRNLEYNRKTDLIEGFEDLGKFGRKASPANQALVLMIRGVYSKWKVPIAYFLSDDGVTYDSLLAIVKKCLEKLVEANLETVGIVCDLSTTNQKVFKHLEVDIKKPYFFLNGKKYYAFFDVPHLLKCVRNNFLNNDFLLNGKFIRFSDIRKDYPEVLKAIDAGYDLLKNLQKVGAKGKLTRPDSFDGFLITINAIKLFADEQKEKGFKYLFTGRLIQDPLENKFSVYRQRGGYNRNPTARSFRSSFKIDIVTNLMHPPKTANAGNSPDEDENILNISVEEGNTLALLNIPEDSSSETDSSNFSSTSIPDYNNIINLEQCGVVYFAGYLIKKCIDKYDCDNCKASLETKEDIDSNENLLTFYKNYDLKYESGLKIPTNLMKKFTFICMNVFSKNIVNCLKKKIIFNVKKKENSHLLKYLPEWFSTNSLCSTHREYILNLLLRTQTFKYCKEFSSMLTTRKDTKNVKLSILQHR